MGIFTAGGSAVDMEAQVTFNRFGTDYGTGNISVIELANIPGHYIYLQFNGSHTVLTTAILTNTFPTQPPTSGIVWSATDLAVTQALTERSRNAFERLGERGVELLLRESRRLARQLRVGRARPDEERDGVLASARMIEDEREKLEGPRVVLP